MSLYVVIASMAGGAFGCLCHSGEYEPVRTQSYHVLGTEALHRTTQQVHYQLLLGQEHLLSAMGRAAAPLSVRPQTDDSLLPVDTVHTARTSHLFLRSHHLLAWTQQPRKYMLFERIKRHKVYGTVTFVMWAIFFNIFLKSRDSVTCGCKIMMP